MASTFKRRIKAKDEHTVTPTSNVLALAGTKAWTGGTTLTSSGLKDLDGILGGGQPLGTCVLIEEDRWTQSLASTLARYWCAEAVSQSQHLMIPTVEVEPFGFGGLLISEENYGTDPATRDGPSKDEVLQFLGTLPFNLHWEKQQKMQQGGTHVSTGIIMETLEETEQDEEDANENGLKIAWQYRKNVQQKRLGHDGSASTSKSTSSDAFCHSFDLARQLSSQLSQQQKPPLGEVVDLSPVQCCENPTTCPAKRSCGFQLYQKLFHHVQTAVKEQPQKVIRLLLYHLNTETISIALPLLLVQIRLLQLPVVVMLCLEPWKSSSSQSKAHFASLHRSSDVVLQTEGFAARSVYPPPPEFRHLHGLLLIRRMSTLTTATANGGGHYADLTVSKRPPANIYGLKRDRRKLHIPLLHIPPEDHTGGGGSVGGGGVRSGAGRPAASTATTACGSGNKDSLLDF